MPGNFNLVNKEPYDENYNLSPLRINGDIDDYKDISIDDEGNIK